jgi:ABC-type transport system involved in multi-copper enzyme maturation permease subunit
MRVFAALLLDAYRELNSRRLFWVVLALSGLFVLAYASIGFDARGMFIGFGLKHFESDLLTEGSPMARLLYRGIFATFIVPIWLAWIATILALVSTASIFPEFVAGGSIDLMLSKPISRLFLFFAKYAASLLFVLLQVSLFCFGVFLAMGWRLGEWEWTVFLAIPLVMLMFSYLFSFCVFIGVWTRSTLAALLLTMLLWFGIYSVSATEGVVLLVRAQMESRVASLDRQLVASPHNADVREGSDPPPPPHNAALSALRTERDEQQATIDSLNRWLRMVRLVNWPMPKTSETVDLISRALSREGDINLMDLIQGNVAVGPDGRPVKRSPRTDEDRAQERVMEEAQRNSPLFIIGTSLLFEMVMLSAAACMFCRRDF